MLCIDDVMTFAKRMNLLLQKQSKKVYIPSSLMKGSEGRTLCLQDYEASLLSILNAMHS